MTIHDEMTIQISVSLFVTSVGSKLTNEKQDIIINRLFICKMQQKKLFFTNPQQHKYSLISLYVGTNQSPFDPYKRIIYACAPYSNIMT